MTILIVAVNSNVGGFLTLLDGFVHMLSPHLSSRCNRCEGERECLRTSFVTSMTFSLYPHLKKCHSFVCHIPNHRPPPPQKKRKFVCDIYVQTTNPPQGALLEQGSMYNNRFS